MYGDDFGPLVAGGQGRSADTVIDSAMFVCFMLLGAGIVALALTAKWIAVAIGVLVILVAIVGSAYSTVRSPA